MIPRIPLANGAMVHRRVDWRRVGLAVPTSLMAVVCGWPMAARSETVLSDFVTTGADMAGARVTARLEEGGAEALVWQATGPASGGVVGTGWSLNQSLDSFKSPWLLKADADTTLSALTINLLEGNALFDVEPSARESLNTPGSKLGAAFSVPLGALGAAIAEPSRVSYSRPIDISQGDLFAALTLEWDDGFRGAALEFVADTDSGTVANPVRVVPQPELDGAISIPLPPPDRVKPRPTATLPLAPDDAPLTFSPVVEPVKSVPESSMSLGLLSCLSLGVARSRQKDV